MMSDKGLKTEEEKREKQTRLGVPPAAPLLGMVLLTRIKRLFRLTQTLEGVPR